MAQGQFDHKVRPGDLIEIYRGAYQHWAVYIGGNEVVHMVTANNGSGCLELLSILDTGKAEVKRDKLQEVVSSDRFIINNLLDDKYEPRKPYAIVTDACSMVGQFLPYNVVNRNCEHFVTNLRYGKPQSRQVKIAATEVAVGVGLLGVAALVALGAALFSGSSEKEEEEEERNNRTRQHNSRGSSNRHQYHHY